MKTLETDSGGTENFREGVKVAVPRRRRFETEEVKVVVVAKKRRDSGELSEVTGRVNRFIKSRTRLPGACDYVGIISVAWGIRSMLGRVWYFW